MRVSQVCDRPSWPGTAVQSSDGQSPESHAGRGFQNVVSVEGVVWLQSAEGLRRAQPLLARRGGSSGVSKEAKPPCRETGWWVRHKKFFLVIDPPPRLRR